MSFYKTLFTLAALAVMASFNAHAESWSCRHDNDVREVHIMQPESAPVPCEVVYKKLTEAVEDQVLWNAQNDASYCEARATEFIGKLEGWGWTCVETIQ